MGLKLHILRLYNNLVFLSPSNKNQYFDTRDRIGGPWRTLRLKAI